MMTPSSLPLETEQMLRSELNFSEKLIWAGQPIASRAGRGSLALVLFGIPWTAFSVFWVIMAIGITSHAASSSSQAASRPAEFPFNVLPFVFPLFGLPFVLIGLGMLSSPYWMRRKAEKTVYALTDQRGLILTPGWRGAVSVQSIAPENLTIRTRTQNPDGSGSIVFNRQTVTRRRAGPDGGTYEVPIGFENIVDVRDVDALIERTFHA